VVEDGPRVGSRQAGATREGILLANSKRGVALTEVARECGLSVGYFSHSIP